MARTYLSIMLVVLVISAKAEDESMSVGLIGAETIRKYDDLQQYGLHFRRTLPRKWDNRWMPQSLDVAAGLFHASDKTATFISIGPSWRHEFLLEDERQWFVDYGIHPTLISRSSFDGTRIGGGFHFTSHFGVGAYLSRDRQKSLIVQYQHTSNGGLRSRNPGIDMVALTLHLGFAEENRPRLAAR